jgi:hypothetical protein
MFSSDEFNELYSSESSSPPACSSMRPCPCSDHPFKLAQKHIWVIPIEWAQDYISSIGNDEMFAITAAERDEAYHNAHCDIGGYVSSDGVYRKRMRVETAPELFVLIKYSPYIEGRTLRCTHDHAPPQYEVILRGLVHDFQYDAQVRKLCADVCDPLVACDIIARCSRVMQDMLMLARYNSIWSCVPKDVIKMIHKMIFEVA